MLDAGALCLDSTRIYISNSILPCPSREPTKFYTWTIVRYKINAIIIIAHSSPPPTSSDFQWAPKQVCAHVNRFSYINCPWVTHTHSTHTHNVLKFKFICEFTDHRFSHSDTNWSSIHLLSQIAAVARRPGHLDASQNGFLRIHLRKCKLPQHLIRAYNDRLLIVVLTIAHLQHRMHPNEVTAPSLHLHQ